MFIETDEYKNLTSYEISTGSKDLIDFISTLSHGEYYVQKLRNLLSRRPCVWVLPDPDYDRKEKEIEKEHKEKIKNNKGEILRLVFECLDIQP
ncbi:MAG: hypothetical protein AAB260_04200, partial [Planctomycetota bacterium]